MHSPSGHEILRSQWVTAGGQMRERMNITNRGDHAVLRNILRIVGVLFKLFRIFTSDDNTDNKIRYFYILYSCAFSRDLM